MTRESFLKSLSPLTRPPHTFSLLMISPVTLPRHSRESDSLSLPVVSPSSLSLVTRVTRESRGRGLSEVERDETLHFTRDEGEVSPVTREPRESDERESDSLSDLVTLSRYSSLSLPDVSLFTLSPHSFLSLSLLTLFRYSLSSLSL